jgi:hypothetical protein
MPPMDSRSGVPALLAALLLALAACGGSSASVSPSATPSPVPTASPTAAASPTPGPSPTPGSSGDTSVVFREIEDQVIAERGLEAKQRPVPILISAAEARARLESHYREKHSADEIAIGEETLKALGLLPPEASLDDLYLELLGSQVAAFYETDTDQLFVISRSGGIGASEKVYFSHEFTHALQDQHFDVEAIDDAPAGQGDRSLARLALVEGDASLLMARWMGTHLSPADLGELLVVDPEAQATLDAMPAILRETLTFPYLQGLILANGIWAEGGWEAIDRAYERLPESTEQVLHPEKYEAGEMPVEVELDAGALAKAMGAGWSGTPEDTLGELQLGIWLRENGVKALPAGDAAAGWGGDRLAYLRGPDGAYALVLRTAWDSAADAAEFLDAAGRVVGDGDSPGTVVRSSATEVVVVLASDGAALNAAVDAAGLDPPD